MRERGKNLFWRLIWGQAGGEGHPHWKATTDPLLAPAFVAQLPQRCSERDIRAEIPWDLCVWGFLLYLISQILSLARLVGDQDEMLLCTKPQADFLPAVVLWMSAGLHQGKAVPGVWVDAAKGWLPKPVQVRVIQRITSCCSWFPVPEEASVVSVPLLTKSCCCVVGRMWDGCSGKTVSTQNLLNMGHTWSRCLVLYWAACPWQGQHNIVCRSSDKWEWQPMLKT